MLTHHHLTFSVPSTDPVYGVERAPLVFMAPLHTPEWLLLFKRDFVLPMFWDTPIERDNERGRVGRWAYLNAEHRHFLRTYCGT
jgi:hypothetical protein